ncbi:MAG: hypothetical protein RIM84_18575 [Alphaproteobacteria bacterium]
MPRRKSAAVDEAALSKGDLRKLNALRKSLGPDIAERAFAEWLATKPEAVDGPPDRAAEVIADAVYGLVEKNNLQIPRGGYLVRRGRGRVIVERPAEE